MSIHVIFILLKLLLIIICLWIFLYNCNYIFNIFLIKVDDSFSVFGMRSKQLSLRNARRPAMHIFFIVFYYNFILFFFFLFIPFLFFSFILSHPSFHQSSLFLFSYATCVILFETCGSHTNNNNHNIYNNK